MGIQTPTAYAGLGAMHRPGDAPYPPQGQPTLPTPAPHYQAYRSEPVQRNEKVYKGLGSGFEQWALHFIEQIETAEQACGFRWPERFKCDITRPDPLQQANELAMWAQMMSDENKALKHIGKEVVNSVNERTHDTRHCYHYDQVGHLIRNCPNRKKKDSEEKENPVNDVALLTNTVDCNKDDGCVMPDGYPMSVSKKGTLTLTAMVDSVCTEIVLTDAYCAPLISFGKLVEKGCMLTQHPWNVGVD
ncbi:hypothetical protein L916_21844 [Phytophthora nicotianae]|uniref:CCHC-type domain-containing protein n=1 Tax=Phytophthora nicotianae TaxID=4792 RepID=W2HQG5_PHYNI|nr:hypothetical protein L916_21844 [Phytophthora nicotianae]